MAAFLRATVQEKSPSLGYRRWANNNNIPYPLVVDMV
jgi:hypothetical protein